MLWVRFGAVPIRQLSDAPFAYATGAGLCVRSTASSCHGCSPCERADYSFEGSVDDSGHWALNAVWALHMHCRHESL